jgi:hypothetical protein
MRKEKEKKKRTMFWTNLNKQVIAFFLKKKNRKWEEYYIKIWAKGHYTATALGFHMLPQKITTKKTKK